MTKLAYLECPTGIAGDMCLGAAVDAGVPLDYLSEQLNRLEIRNEYRLRAEQVRRNTQQATKVYVELVHPVQSKHNSHALSDPVDQVNQVDQSDPSKVGPLASSHPSNHHASHARHLPEIEHLIQAAKLPARVEAWSLAIFRRLAEAEGAVHGIAPEQVHFHEVGAVDAIVDIVGTCLGLDWLGIEVIYCSPLPTGGGTVKAAHGLLPVPAPAVLKLWEIRQVPLYSNGIQRELVTPTGAAIVTTLASQFGGLPAMTLRQVGLGAGSRDLAIPNILRLWIGDSANPVAEARSEFHPTSQPTFPPLPAPTFSPIGGVFNATHAHSADAEPLEPSTSSASSPDAHASHSWQEPIVVLETQVDDLTPQAIGYLFEALFAAGAVDVFTQAIGMKKSRPGVLLTVLTPPKHTQACETILFQETTTLGIRHSQQQRTVLPRVMQTVQTKYGAVRIKVARRTSEPQIIDGHPEFEDCAQLARQSQIPWREIHQAALYEWYRGRQPGNLEPS